MKEFSRRAQELAGKKLYYDYCRTSKVLRRALEPEAYFEDWSRWNLTRVDEKFKNGVFREFLGILVRRAHSGGY